MGVIQNDCTKFLELENIFYKFNDCSTALIRPFQLELNKWLVFAARDLSIFATEKDPGCFSVKEKKETGKLVLITKAQGIFSIPVMAVPEYEKDIGSFWCLVLLKPLPELIAKKVFEYKKILLSTCNRKEERYDVGVAGSLNFKLAKPDCVMLVGDTQIRCIFNNVSIHGALVIGQKAVYKKNDTRISILANFVLPNEKITQKGIIVNSEKMANELFSYSIRFIEPISLLWQKRIRDYSILLEEKT